MEIGKDEKRYDSMWKIGKAGVSAGGLEAEIPRIWESNFPSWSWFRCLFSTWWVFFHVDFDFFQQDVSNDDILVCLFSVFSRVPTLIFVLFVWKISNFSYFRSPDLRLEVFKASKMGLCFAAVGAYNFFLTRGLLLVGRSFGFSTMLRELLLKTNTELSNEKRAPGYLGYMSMKYYPAMWGLCH